MIRSHDLAKGVNHVAILRKSIMAEGIVRAKALRQKHEGSALEIARCQYAWNGGVTMLNLALRNGSFLPFVSSSLFETGVPGLTLECPTQSTS